MRILKVIHGYPPAYNAGSEVYSQTLCEALSKRHEVHVFTREENPFLSEYAVHKIQDPHVTKHLINLPLLRQRYRYQHKVVDDAFSNLLETINPHIIHIGHLNHLSTSLLEKVYTIPVVFTLHDYWLLCPRGQFIQRNPEDPQEIWKNCDGQENRKCAERCYSGYFSGAANEQEEDINYWTGWVRRRQEHLKKVLQRVEVFIAPSRYLLERFEKELPLVQGKITYLDYGFDTKRLQNRKREAEEHFVFGYIGTHTPQKGIHVLLHALKNLKGSWHLRIWGRFRSEVTRGLQQIAATLPLDVQRKIEWCPEYNNEDIVQIFNQVDCIVVPSIWVENSPLVIHEAQQVGVPVITANVGGMKEFVHHNKNGLLFDFHNSESLRQQMQQLVDNPKLAKDLGEKRYLYSKTGDVVFMERHVEQIEEIYQTLLNRRVV